MTTVAIIDYGLGNTKSICAAFAKSGANVTLTSDEKKIMSADGVVLPGVGAFSHAMERLKSQKMDQIIRDFVDTGKPFLGICLGMQMLFEQSTEFGVSEGLCLIPGQVRRLEPKAYSFDKVPHVTWSRIFSTRSDKWQGTILDSLDEEDMYFVHSYYATPSNSDHILSLSQFSGYDYCSTVKSGNVYGCQYHPEKSAKAGLRVIRNFSDICGSKDW